MKFSFFKKITVLLATISIFCLTAMATSSAYALDDYSPKTSTNPPAIISAENSFGAVTFKWETVPETAKYLVFKKTSNTEFSQIAETTDIVYTDTQVTNNLNYTYAIKCADQNGVPISDFGIQKTIKYIAAPEITNFGNRTKSTVIKWNKIEGASKYRLYLLDANRNWKLLKETDSNTFNHKGVKNGTSYTYTIRCVDSKGSLLSGYNPVGKTNLYLSPIKISSVKRVKKSNVIKWNKTDTASSYKVYRTSLGGKRIKIAEVTKPRYTDKTAKSGVAYKYTVLAYNGQSKAITYYNNNEKYYSNGKLANGVFSYKKGKCAIKKGVVAEKLVIKSKTMYFYNSKGKLLKKGIVGNSKLGYYYASSSGKINKNYCAPVKSNKKLWNVVCGKATIVKTESDKTLYRALKVVKKVTKTDMTKKQKLRKCYNYLAKNYSEHNPRIPHYSGENWHIMYANDIFKDGGGNCFSYGAAFAYMAKAIGYTDVYACNSGGHGWAEVNNRVFDPERSRWDDASDFFNLKYTAGPVSHYKGALSSNRKWGRVKI